MKWVSKLVFALFFIGFPTIFLSDSYDPTAIVFMGIVVAVYIAVYALVIGTPLGIILLLLVIRLEDNQEWWSILALSSVISSLISASVLLSYRVDFTNGLLLIPLTGIVGAVFSIYLHQSIKGPVHY